MGQSVGFEPVLELCHRLLLTNEVKRHAFGTVSAGGSSLVIPGI